MTEEPYRFRHQRDNRSLSVDEETLKTIDEDSKRIMQPPPLNNPDKGSTENSKKKYIIIFAGVVAAVVLLGVVFYLGRMSSQVSKTQQVSESKRSETVRKAIIDEKVDTSDLGKFIKPTTGEKWYKEPKELPSQGYVAASYVESVKYFEVGTRDKNTIILGYLNYGIGGSAELFEKTPDGQVRHIAQPSSTANYSTQQTTVSEPLYVASVVEDTSIHYDSLSIPGALAIGNGDTVRQTEYPDLGVLSQEVGTEGVTTKDIKTYGESKVMRTERSYVDTKLTSVGYVLQLPIGTQVKLIYEPIPPKLTSFTWDNNVNSDDTIYGIVRGCGAGGSVSRADNVTNDDFVSIGKSPDGQTIYGFKNSDATLLTKAYEEYVDFYRDVTETEVVSKEDFIKNHGIIAYKSKQGEWLIYTTDRFSPAYGCAKPVVYLYPSKTTDVTVKVGADVKISDPWYDPQNGWTATAQPTGQLTVNSQKFDSLFWEGPGFGEYPAINSGVIVKRSEATKTIKKQLAQQGLNAKESQDFMDYWQDKIPRKPYVRLTWLTNKQLNQLAPLYISPKPDTLHRVFLDMAGYDKPIKIAPQKLETVQRKGFTVTEWGGLSTEKLY